MPLPRFDLRHVRALSIGLALAFGLVSIVSGQSQEPKPKLPTPSVTPGGTTDGTTAETGVTGNTWRGPTWGISVTWDPQRWSVDDEFLTDGYDGLRLSTPLSTVYIEAYGGSGGNAEACLAAAEEEIRGREGVTEVAPLEDQPVPTGSPAGAASRLFGLTVTLPDGTPFRVVEFVECRTLVPDVAVLELTWQTATETFNDEFSGVEDLFAALEVPGAGETGATPVSGSPTPPLATPVS